MTECSKCYNRVVLNERCYLPRGRDCNDFTPLEKSNITSHTFIFETSSEWSPDMDACWGECPFAMNIKLNERCKYKEYKNCPFILRGLIDDEVYE